ncbi:hypothetical protein SARC_07135 [Sphaeroforma arctica JP610]|uniref:Major facilitator superfamily (MFS) profile domain-containing protein n=1 Tax=Sphaeroforma arctica JP610 TaxID=667725 RepID=A0A0L0FX29_9EUKA|nr:hypothetical protein SARC_07135 [Sphaeroforma arctica JP610]KNC80513.1 hypothetical protein SARC_07135 [Sphaeroforma arctica JP610]|eukprot:XP_014154415.1 hypothetical protein SARC_07135 [Sphaeroforma arctica JP610]
MESVSKHEETRRGSVDVTPLPWPKLIPALGLQLAEAITTEMLFPFVAFMVKDFHLTDDDKKLGYYAGYIVSSFLLAQFVSSFGWGVISDSVGELVQFRCI